MITNLTLTSKRIIKNLSLCPFLVILKGSDLSTTSTKKVRQELEDKLDVKLASRRKEIDDLVMEYVNANKSGDDKNDESEEEPEENEEEEDEEEVSVVIFNRLGSGFH